MYWYLYRSCLSFKLKMYITLNKTQFLFFFCHKCITSHVSFVIFLIVYVLEKKIKPKMFWWIQNWYCDIDAKNVDSGIELGKYNIVHHSSAFSGSSSLYVHYFNPTFRAIHSAANVCGCVGLWLLSSFYTHIGGAPFKKKKKRWETTALKYWGAQEFYQKK